MSTISVSNSDAGLADVCLTDVYEPVCYGPDATAALAWVRRSSYELLKRLDPAAVARAPARLRHALGARTSDQGVPPA